MNKNTPIIKCHSFGVAMLVAIDQLSRDITASDWIYINEELGRAGLPDLNEVLEMGRRMTTNDRDKIVPRYAGLRGKAA